MVDIHDLYAGILSNVHMEAPHKTMDKKLIINVGPDGLIHESAAEPGPTLHNGRERAGGDRGA